MKRETFDLVLGLGVLVLGIALLLFTFVNALALVANPGPFIAGQLPAGGQPGQGPSASFTWTSNGFNLTVQDTSRSGGTSLSGWEWDFGDSSGTVQGQNPGVHVYGSPGPYTVYLTVRDSNGGTSTSLSLVEVVPSQMRSGRSLDIGSQLSQLSTGFEQLLLPVGVATLTVGLYLAMAVIGGLITKAGWNMIRPRPETIRIRLKPRHLQEMFEADQGTAQAAMGASAPPPPPPQA